MRRVIVTEFISLDGVMEDPGGSEGTRSGGWTFHFPDPDQMTYKFDEIFAHDALLLGRVTYEGFASVWPTIQEESGFADRMNAIPKYVVSTTLSEAIWQNSTLIANDVVTRIQELKDERRCLS